MENKIYTGYILDKSQKDKTLFHDLPITNCASIWFGIIKVYEVQIEEEQIEFWIDRLQKNMTTHILFQKYNLFPQEFYCHFYSVEKLIVVYRDKIFHATKDKTTWTEAITHGIGLGIVEKQLDFLTPEENKKRYFSKKI